MILPRLGSWSGSSGVFLRWERIYWKGHWTPFCHVRRRYRSWLGYWGR